MSDHTLTLIGRGEAKFLSQTEADDVDVTITETHEIAGEIELDTDRLYNGDVATTHSHGVAISTQDTAKVICDAVGAVPVNASDWELTIEAPLDDWQHVALGVAKQRKSFESKQVECALDVLVSLHDLAQSDRPILAALNIDETYDAGQRDELLEVLSADEIEPEADGAVGVSADA